MPTCLIGLGSNLGDRGANVADAIAQLAHHVDVRVVATSRLLENPAIGGPAGSPDFLNGVVRIETELSAQELLDLLHKIEGELGRTRELHWGPRTIDLDLLLYGDAVIDTPSLQVPHPRMRERAFVLEPAAEVGGDLVHPRFGRTVAELLAEIQR